MTGDVSAPYHAAHAAAVVADRSDRVLLRMYGRDPLRILQGVVTNDVASATTERAVYAALLTAKGRMVSELRILRRADDFLLDVPALALTALMETFRRTVPPLFARFEDLSTTYRVLGVYGPAAAAVLQPHLPLPADTEHAVVQHEAALVVRTRSAGVAGYDVIAPAADVAALAAGLDAPRIDDDVLEVLRVEAGMPRWGAELTDTTIPLEAGLEHAISTGKGCYTGQEVIIRILHRGHVNWHVRGVELGEAAASAGASLVQPETGKAVGRLTSVVWSPRFAQHLALAYVRREVEPPAHLRLETTDGPPARVVALPFA